MMSFKQQVAQPIRPSLWHSFFLWGGRVDVEKGSRELHKPLEGREKIQYFFSTFEVLGLRRILNPISTIIAGTSELRIKSFSYNHEGYPRASQTSFNFMCSDADLRAHGKSLQQ